MPKTPLAASPGSRRGSVVWSTAILLTAVQFAAGGCQGIIDYGPAGGGGSAAGIGSPAGSGSGGSNPSSNGGSGGAGLITSGGGTTRPTGAAGSGGTTSTSGASGSGGTTGTSAPSASGGASGNGGATSGAGGGSATSVPKPCLDLEPPPDPKWPGATCKNWAAETTECTAAWFATYCDVSCGRCVPPGGGAGGAGGSGGSTARDAGTNTGGSAGTGGTNAGTVDAASNPSSNCSAAGLPSVTGSIGWASRYWDCCQTHCGQSDGHRCSQDGTTRTGDSTSSCAGGGAYACYDEAPRVVSDCLSYGYIAKANPNCGGCYRIQFTGEGQHNVADPGSVAIKGKQMIVKVSNTGGDVASNQFDLMIPGGGVGLFNACSKQWGTSDLGAQYGGFMTSCTGDYAAKKECVRQQCSKVPSGPARQGCLWYVDWLQAADNPKFSFQATSCPF